MIKRSAALLALLLLPVAACTDKPAKERLACGVVVDNTGFARDPKARKTTEGLINARVPELKNGCDWVAFAAITGNSETTNCRQFPVQVEPAPAELPNDNPKRKAALREAHWSEVPEHAKALLDCPADGSSGSDVLGGLRAIAIQLDAAPDSKLKRQVWIFSDLLNNKGALQLQRGDYSTPRLRQSKLDELRKEKLVPDFKDVDLRVYGFGLISVPDPDRVPQLRSFWQELFTASGARYSAF